MLVFHTPLSVLHDPPYEILSGCAQPYFESPDRIALILAALLADDITNTDTVCAFEEHRCDWTRDEITADRELLKAVARVHSPAYLDFLSEIYDEWVAEGGSKDAALPETFLRKDLLLEPDLPDTTSKGSAIARIGRYSFDLSAPVTAETWVAALASTKVALEALAALRTAPAAFALCRPPGHHATDELCGGYCYLNSAAVAARHFQAELGEPSRVAILDIDYHHGNGTSKIFYDDPSILYVSLHATPDYPYYTGSMNERGGRKARGFNLNYPLPLHTADQEYLATLSQATGDVVSFDPDLVIVSLGVDTYIDDPITQFRITSAAYPKMGELIADIKKPTLFIMEGGYNKAAIGKCVRGVLEGFQLASGGATVAAE